MKTTRKPAFATLQRRRPSLLAAALACVVAAGGIGLLAGCASTKITSRNRIVYERLPRPNHIFIYNFADTSDSIPSNSMFAGQSFAAPTAEEAALGQELGSSIAAQLTSDVREMGLPAVQVSAPVSMQVNDIVIRGYLVSIDEGSTVKRMTLGFGSGGSELTTVVEGYQMTAYGLRKLGTASTGANSGKGPGATLGAAGWLITGSPVGLVVGGGLKVYGEASGNATIQGRAKATAKEIADLLKRRFQEEDWIY